MKFSQPAYSRQNRSECNSTRLVLAILLPVTALCQTKETPLDFQKADVEIVRLSPSRFPQLPPAIQQELTRRGCAIPQVWGEKGAHNVIKGSFIKPNEIDWAVLCSVDRTSAILVFRNALPTRVIELAREADINKLQGEGDEKVGYSREISPVGRDFIMRHYGAYGGVKPPPIDHQGIDDAFVGKASVVLYFHRGKWHALTGAD
jgi:hypothetical protein